MMDWTLKERAGFYNSAFPKWTDSHLTASERWIQGMWILGNDYKGSGYYGAYPPNYLRRVMSLFPDAKYPLHLFSGSLPKSPNYTRFDFQPTDISGDAHKLSSLVPEDHFDLILADPPYSREDAENYGSPMVNRNFVLKECAKVVKVGGFIVWLDQVLPMYRKDSVQNCGAIGVVRSTNHRFRVVSLFRKL